MTAQPIELHGNIYWLDFKDEDIPWKAGQELFAFWGDQKKGRRYPARADFSPVSLKKWLPSVVLLDILPEQDDFKIRLCGTAVADQFPKDPTGMRIRDLPNGTLTGRRIGAILHLNTPVLSRGLELDWADKKHRTFDSLNLPLAKDGETMDMLLILINVHALKR